MRLRRRRTETKETEKPERADPTDKGADPGPGSRPDPDRDDIASQFTALVAREWGRMSAAGTWWTGAGRVAIAAEARAAVAGNPSTGALDPAATEATRRVATQACTIRRFDLERWEADGLDGFTFVEVVGVVSRLMALDVAAFGLGRDQASLPEPEPGEPSRQRPDDAAITTGWAPTVGPANAPSTLTAVPPESDAMFDVHGVLYATMKQMGDIRLERNGLSRPQIELVAARTSRLNDCFY